MSLTSSKISIARLVKICQLKNLKYVVISPGSRNAPLIISFAENQSFECLNIPDERSAGFFALGMAQKLSQPVILCCTSGSAAVNYAPAIVEAYYQKIPLLILTADRPLEWIDQRAGQTIRQREVFSKYIKKSYELIEEADQEDHIWYNDRIINEAVNETMINGCGPVHINVPLREPLYDTVDEEKFSLPKIIATHSFQRRVEKNLPEEISEEWKSHESVLVLIGQRNPSKSFDTLIGELAQIPKVVVLTETTSNVHAKNLFPSIDRLIDGIQSNEYDRFSPDLIISIGGALISKKIRFMLRRMKVKAHWQVDPYPEYTDTYKALTRKITLDPEVFLDKLLQEEVGIVNDAFRQTWEIMEETTRQRHQEFVKEVPWSDLYLFDRILPLIPPGVLQMASSTAVRYVQLFPSRADLKYYCNRGVSGIDGCTSTAAGFAFLSSDTVTLITGDIAFFYDSNGLWHNHLSSNLRIVLINNGGGNIFRYVQGPDQTNHLEKHFESQHDAKAKGIAEAYNLEYLSIDKQTELNTAIDWLYGENRVKASILEIFTPGNQNIDYLKDYFSYLKKEQEPN